MITVRYLAYKDLLAGIQHSFLTVSWKPIIGEVLLNETTSDLSKQTKAFYQFVFVFLTTHYSDLRLWDLDSSVFSYGGHLYFLSKDCDRNILSSLPNHYHQVVLWTLQFIFLVNLNGDVIYFCPPIDHDDKPTKRRVQFSLLYKRKKIMYSNFSRIVWVTSQEKGAGQSLE